MKKCMFFLFGLLALQSVYGQNQLNSISGIIGKGSRKIRPIESEYRIVEKTLYETIFKQGTTASSSFQYSLYGDRTYHVRVFPDETDKIARIYLQAYVWDKDAWKIYKTESTTGRDIEMQIDTKKLSYFKFEVSCIFKNSTDNYVRYGLFVDREL